MNILTPIKTKARYKFEDVVNVFQFGQNVIISGNSSLKEFGDKILLKIVNGKYFDKETGYNYKVLDELKKVTKRGYKLYTMKSSDQLTWQGLYYTKRVKPEAIAIIEDLYMGNVAHFKDEDGKDYYVPNRIAWKGKNAICSYLGMFPANTIIKESEAE